MNKIVSWAIALPFFWEGCASIPFLCFNSLVDQIKYSETPKYLEQYFCDQESGTKINICNFLVFEAMTNFSFIAACSLSTLCRTLFLYLKHMQQKCSPCTHFKPFSIYLLHLKCDCVGQLHGY